MSLYLNIHLNKEVSIENSRGPEHPTDLAERVWLHPDSHRRDHRKHPDTHHFQPEASKVRSNSSFV